MQWRHLPERGEFIRRSLAFAQIKVIFLEFPLCFLFFVCACCQVWLLYLFLFFFFSPKIPKEKKIQQPALTET